LQPWICKYITTSPDELIQIGIPQKKVIFSTFAIDLPTNHPILPKDSNVMSNLYKLKGSFPVILSIGRLHPDKGHEFAIRAIQFVVSYYPSCKLIIYGIGKDKHRLQNLTEKLGLTNHVIFGGFQKNLRESFLLTDIYLKTSLNEGVNLSNIQAMAYGKPTIAFDTGGKGYFGPGYDKTTIKVKIRDVPALASAIMRLSQNKNLRTRYGEGAKVYAQLYQSMQATRTYEQIYYELFGFLGNDS